MQLLIMGPPGAGKGTQAVSLAARYQIPAISTGDMFRAMRTADTDLARQVCDIMAAGGYVTDEITNAIVADRLTQPDCGTGFLLDGYPRTLDQVHSLDALLDGAGASLDAVVALHADIEELVTRLLLRATSSGRSDDDEPTIRIRQQTFHDQTAPLLAVYRERGLLVEVDGLGEVDDVTARLAAALEQHLVHRRAAATP
jgi:adenylate kinase